MGTPRDFENGAYEYYKENQGITKSYYLIIFISSLLISIIGGSMLGWWLHKYHPTNRQLWMVPFGLILLLTPVLVWLSLIISDLCISKKEEEDVLKTNQQRIHPLDESLCAPKEMILWCTRDVVMCALKLIASIFSDFDLFNVGNSSLLAKLITHFWHFVLNHSKCSWWLLYTWFCRLQLSCSFVLF